ncbi:hypothetical protein SmJEL517_g05243 [Synchytrium microbalum]|uniref:NEDD8-conjugating enzyme UBC12 n=1 Tax=Synchytrium microbalum TaxID=1806994 RepID=A0A507C1M4_9FUNG|nr:uncharacterized protein SmJEL517_g05243 [Synchytrium microbalum]TPX31403.1 hypothetical protein SmJEL517_g05243 [Synchytrium microbalum]
MINIMSMKKKQAEGAAGGPKKAKASAAHLRLTTDMNEMKSLPKTMKLEFTDPDDLFNFNFYIYPDEGFYKGGKFKFTFKFNTNYPHEPPKVLCAQKIYHPNIDLEGNVCLNILREDWKPVLNINSITVGLQYLFLEPNADDPLNKDAAQVLRKDRRQFEQNVNRSMRGGSIEGNEFDYVL